MKKLLLFFASMMIVTVVDAQQYEWIQQSPNNYQWNPTMTAHTCASDKNGHVYFARMDSMVQVYSIDVYGRYALETRDTTGNLLQSTSLEGKAVIQYIAVDASGNTYLTGKFMDQMIIGGQDTMQTSLPGFNPEVFVVSIDQQGAIRWKWNLSSQFPDERPEALAVDPAGNLWLATTLWTSSSLYKINPANGALLDMRYVSGTRTIGDIAFDTDGSMYVSGSTESGNFTAGGQQYTVTETYSMFLFRYHPDGQAHWLMLAHDVTFQRPEIETSGDGHVYFCSPLFDSITLGTHHITRGQWVYDFVLARLDSLGSVDWAINAPQGGPIKGDMTTGQNKYLQCDEVGNAIFLGNLRGSLNWGNGVVTNAGAVTTYGLATICFNTSGVAQWALVANGPDANIFGGAMTYAGNGNLYFVNTVVGAANYGTINAGIGGPNAQGTVEGKISFPAATVGLPTNYISEDLSLFPNPAQAVIHLKNVDSNNQYRILSATGALVDQGTIRNEELSVTGLSAGSYLLIINDKNGQQQGRFIKLP